MKLLSDILSSLQEQYAKVSRLLDQATLVSLVRLIVQLTSASAKSSTPQTSALLFPATPQKPHISVPSFYSGEVGQFAFTVFTGIQPSIPNLFFLQGKDHLCGKFSLGTGNAIVIEH